MMENPFRYGGIVTGTYLADQTVEIHLGWWDFQMSHGIGPSS